MAPTAEDPPERAFRTKSRIWPSTQQRVLHLGRPKDVAGRSPGFSGVAKPKFGLRRPKLNILSLLMRQLIGARLVRAPNTPAGAGPHSETHAGWRRIHPSTLTCKRSPRETLTPFSTVQPDVQPGVARRHRMESRIKSTFPEITRVFIEAQGARASKYAESGADDEFM